MYISQCVIFDLGNVVVYLPEVFCAVFSVGALWYICPRTSVVYSRGHSVVYVSQVFCGIFIESATRRPPQSVGFFELGVLSLQDKVSRGFCPALAFLAETATTFRECRKLFLSTALQAGPTSDWR